MDRRQFIKSSSAYVLAGAAGSGLLAACGDTSETTTTGSGTSATTAAGATTTLAPDNTLWRYQAPSRFTLLQAFILAASERGYFDDVGLNVELVAGTGTADSITQVAAGQALIGVADPLSLAPLIADDDAGIISIAEIAPKVFWEVASLPEAPLRHPRDWQGKTIGIASVGGATEKFLDAAAVVEGLDPTGVNKVVTGLDAGSYAFLEQGEVDGFIAFYSSKAALLQQPDVSLEYLNLGEFVPLPSSCFFVATESLTDNAKRNAVVKWLKATRASFRYAWDDANIDDVLDVLAIYQPSAVEDRELATATWEVLKTYMSSTDASTFIMDPARWDNAHKLIFDAGFLQNTTLPYDAFYTNMLLEEV